ncbi:MAG: extracellular solute-binding protein [Actinophytocola sp.]|nr:extracellular solute-binding protein [Actinophytocola sp.]
MRSPVLAVVSALVFVVSGCGVLSGEEADLQVYTGRHYDLEQAFTQFEDETGITVEFLSGSDAELRERISAEGEDTTGDIYMTVDAGNLWKAAEDGLLSKLDSSKLQDAVPEGLRDPDQRWYGLAMRARTVMYNPDKVTPSEFASEQTYADLADPKWQGRLCMRESTSPYTQSLVAAMIDEHGKERATEIVQGWVDNDVEVFSNDVQILENIDAGTCDVGLTNHYYLARLLAENPDLSVTPFWANQDGRGTHVNISGAGVIANSDNPKQARQLIEWLATKGQNTFVDGNHEYPVNPDVEPEPIIKDFGEFDFEPINAQAYGELNSTAIEVMNEVGYE